MKRLRIAAAAALLLLCVVAVGGLVWFRWAQHAVASRIGAPDLTLARAAAPEMQFLTLDGTPMHLSEMKGKVVFLDLWGTWCVQCVAEMPTVQKLYEHYQHDRRVQLLIVSRMDTAGRVRSYAERNHYTLPFFRMSDADIPTSMRLQQFPSTFLLDKQGQIVVTHTGAADWSAPSVVRLIDQLKDE